MCDLEDAIDKCSRMIDELPSLTEYRAALSKIVDLEAQLAAARAEIVRLNDLREAEAVSARRQMTKQAVEIEQLRALAKEGEKP